MTQGLSVCEQRPEQASNYPSRILDKLTVMWVISGWLGPQAMAERMAYPSNPHSSQNNYDSRFCAGHYFNEWLLTEMTAGRRIMEIGFIQWIDPFTLYIGTMYASFLWCHLLFRSQLVMVCINLGGGALYIGRGMHIIWASAYECWAFNKGTRDYLQKCNIYFLNNCSSSFSWGFGGGECFLY